VAKAIRLAPPASVLRIIVATVINALFGWRVGVIGEFPKTLLLDRRLTFEVIPRASSTRVRHAGSGDYRIRRAGESALRRSREHRDGIGLQANQELIATISLDDMISER
jgi:hypothetical protein